MCGVPAVRQIDRSRNTETERRRRAGRVPPQFGPVVWIAVLLAAWFLIVEWPMLPELLNAARAAWH
jgi:hypothetical protein